MKIYVVAIIFFVGAIYLGPNIYEHFGKRYTNADRKIYEENYSFIRGTIQHINRLKLEYETATNDAHRLALRESILSEASIISQDKLPYELKAFINKLK